MQGYIVFGLFCTLVFLVIIRIRLLRGLGIEAFQFGKMDKRDFLIPPFVLLFLYLFIAHVFGLPYFGAALFSNAVVAWLGVAFGLCGVALFAWALISFGKSFRVGLDEKAPGELVTTGAFAISRNPIYVAFFLVLLAILLVYPDVMFLIYLVAATLLFNHQVRLEEQSLKKVYGQQYLDYMSKVRRYL